MPDEKQTNSSVKVHCAFDTFCAPFDPAIHQLFAQATLLCDLCYPPCHVWTHTTASQSRQKRARVQACSNSYRKQFAYSVMARSAACKSACACHSRNLHSHTKHWKPLQEIIHPNAKPGRCILCIRLSFAASRQRGTVVEPTRLEPSRQTHVCVNQIPDRRC